MKSSIAAGFLTESEFPSWTSLLEASAEGSVYSSPVYLGALCEAAGGRFKLLAARRGQELLGGIAIYERDAATRVRLSPRPLLFYNGILLRDHETKYPSQRTSRVLEVMGVLETALANAGYESVVLKNRPSITDARTFMANGWSVRPGYSYVVPIADLPAAWDRIEQNLRRLVKRCGEQGMQLTDDEDFDSFYRMHEGTAERKGSPLYLPQPQFQKFFSTLRERGLCRLYHARLPNGQTVSSQLVFTGKHPVSHTVSAAADPAYLNTGATAFLRWKAFEALSAQGYVANDLTDAALNPVSHFKSQLGGDLELCLIIERSWNTGGWRSRIRSITSRFGGIVSRR